MNDNIVTDEISLYDLMNVLKRRKYILCGIILAGLIIISGLYFISSISYKLEVLLKIGKIADLPLEKFEDLNLYCQKNAELNNIYYLPSGEASGKYFRKKGINIDDKPFIILTEDKKKSSGSTVVISVVSKGKSYDDTVNSIERFEKMVVTRHNDIYKSSIVKFNKLQLESDKNFKTNYSYLIESYSYPTERLENINTYQVKMGIETILTDNNKTAPVIHKGLIKYLILSFIGLAFISVIIVFIADFILAEINRRKE